MFGIAEALVDELLGEGHIVILDATHLLARYRAPAEKVARSHGVPVRHVLVTSDDGEIRARLDQRMRERNAGDHSEADLEVYTRMRARAFEPPAEYVEVRNGDEIASEIERVASLIASAP